MLEKYDKTIIMELIDEGYELERISLEFKIPIIELQKLKLELERKKANIINARNGIVTKRKTISDMEEMRIKYNSLINGENKESSELSGKKLSDEEQQIVQNVINEAKQLIELSKSNPLINQRLKIFFLNIKKIQNFPLTLNQLEQLKDIINDEFFKKISDKKLYPMMKENQKIIMDKYLQAIDEYYSNARDIESLKYLIKKLSGTFQRPYTLPIESRKRKIENQINSLMQKNAMNSIERRCSPEVLNIAKKLASGTCDIKKASEFIDLEAKKMWEKSEKNKFVLTEEQNKNKIFTQIKTLIRENAEKYPIDDPKKVSTQMMKLFNCQILEVLPCIVDNMVKRNEFKKTDIFIDSVSKNVSDYRSIRMLKRKVKIAEIGSIIVKGLKAQGTPEEEKAYVDLIENGLERYQLNPNLIIIGKAKNGKDILLSDIMPTRRER